LDDHIVGRRSTDNSQLVHLGGEVHRLRNEKEELKARLDSQRVRQVSCKTKLENIMERLELHEEQLRAQDAADAMVLQLWKERDLAAKDFNACLATQ